MAKITIEIEDGPCGIVEWKPSGDLVPTDEGYTPAQVMFIIAKGALDLTEKIADVRKENDNLRAIKAARLRNQERNKK